VLLVPLPSFCFEAATRRVEDLVFHEAVETMRWQEETEEDSHKGFQASGLGEGGRWRRCRSCTMLLWSLECENGVGIGVCFNELFLEDRTRDVCHGLVDVSISS
jgi:hypothetical protein